MTTQDKLDAMLDRLVDVLHSQLSGLPTTWGSIDSDHFRWLRELAEACSILHDRPTAQLRQAQRNAIEDALVLHCWIALMCDDLPRGVREELAPRLAGIKEIRDDLEAVYQQLGAEQQMWLIHLAEHGRDPRPTCGRCKAAEGDVAAREREKLIDAIMTINDVRRELAERHVDAYLEQAKVTG